MRSPGQPRRSDESRRPQLSSDAGLLPGPGPTGHPRLLAAVRLGPAADTEWWLDSADHPVEDVVDGLAPQHGVGGEHDAVAHDRAQQRLDVLGVDVVT